MTTNETSMTRSLGRRTQRAVVTFAAATGLVATTMAASPGRSAAQTVDQRVGIICTNGTGGAGVANFSLDSTEGYITLPDGNTAYMWGYKVHGGSFQHPGPVLCVNEGDLVTVSFTNTLATTKTLGEPLSIMFPGQENVLANGIPAQPETPAGAGTTSLTKSAAFNQTVTYSFVADHAGTFVYESGTDPQTQVRMGLFGALIVRPSLAAPGLVTGTKYAYHDPATAYMPNEDFLVLLSEIDPYQHQAVEGARTRTTVPLAVAYYNSRFKISNYHPRYWLINGRGFPDSIADNNASWLPTQPYGALAKIYPFSTTGAGKAYHPYPGLARYINVGTEDYPFHPHGNNGAIIGRDGHQLANATNQDMSMEKFSINIGPGQTWDVLFKWFDAEGYSETNPVPVTVPNVANQEFGMFYSGSPYLGSEGTKPPGFSTQNQCGEFYIIAHNHALYQITSWGVNMTGPITYMRIDDPLSTKNCG
jgi:FtsP/CotA-like multicopper oxidase with cupredoxin domain